MRRWEDNIKRDVKKLECEKGNIWKLNRHRVITIETPPKYLECLLIKIPPMNRLTSS